MSTAAVVVMASICSLIWGGFALLLRRAVRREGGKSAERAAEAPVGPSP